MTKDKLSHRFGGSLDNNDLSKIWITEGYSPRLIRGE
jgi:hypothetical protein